jgi:hypothetical protein
MWQAHRLQAMTRQPLARDNPKLGRRGPRRPTLVAAALSCVVLLAGGCPPETYPNLVPATLTEITRIHDDTTLRPQEQREQLEALGLSPLTINAVLQDKDLGNQFGGDLRSTYLKVVKPDFEALTPDEIQIYAAAATSVQSALGISFTDLQAQDIVDFFATADLSSPEELATFLDATPEFVPASVTAANLLSLFVTFDPALVLPLLP